MRILVKILLVLAVIFAILMIIGFFLPSSTSLSRTATIDTPAKVVFDQVNDVKAWEAWSPWAEMDKTMKVTYADKTVGKGAKYSWTGEKSGEGSLTITESVPAKSIKTYLDFGGQGNANGSWQFNESNGKTDVTWGFVTEHGWNVVSRYFGKFLMEGMLGKNYEDGLAKLKQVAEEKNKELIKLEQIRIEAEKRQQAIQDSISAAAEN